MAVPVVKHSGRPENGEQNTPKTGMKNHHQTENFPGRLPTVTAKPLFLLIALSPA
ncbi:hypothetical protein [Mesorhizobium sp. IMUNJ 23232]|uniref:hypothetical protein n=1 Tax=Mesorhizobium sp. IMUNJ 23232 TaxID=3376064 RepID=UPI003794623D